MDDYFVTVRPEPADREPMTREQVEKIDLSVFHQPASVPRWTRPLMVGGWVMMAVAMLLLIALVGGALLGFLHFLDSLPW